MTVLAAWGPRLAMVLIAASVTAGALVRVVVLGPDWLPAVDLGPGTTVHRRPPEPTAAQVVSSGVSWRRLSGTLLRGRGGTMALLWGLTVVVTAVDLAAPWPVQVIVDVVLGGRHSDGLGGLVAGMTPLTATVMVSLAGVALVVVAGLLSAQVVVLAGALEEHSTLRLRRVTLRAVLDAPPFLPTRLSVGELQTRLVEDTARVSRGCLALSEALVPDALVVGGMAVVIVLVDWRLAVVALAFVPFLALAARWRNPGLHRTQDATREASGRLAAHLADVLARRTGVRLFDARADEVRRGVDLARHEASAALRGYDAAARFGPVAELLPAVAFAGVLVMGVVEVTATRLSTGELLVVLAYVSSLHAPIRRLSRISADLARGRVSRDRVIEVLRLAGEWPSPPAGAAGTRPPRAALATSVPLGASTTRQTTIAPAVRPPVLSVRDLSFGYDPARPVIHDLTFDLLPGQVLALVGESGSGKSTLLWLLARLLTPGYGSIAMHGVSLDAIDESALRQLVAVAPQEPLLHPGSLRDNIGYGMPWTSSGEIAWAARAAGVDRFMSDLPRGLDTPLGPRGEGLSGGQQRRVALARAVVRRAPAVLLDEPTAGLDRPTALHVLDGLLGALAGSAVVIATHDADVVRAAHRVVHLDGLPGPRSHEFSSPSACEDATGSAAAGRFRARTLTPGRR